MRIKRGKDFNPLNSLQPIRSTKHKEKRSLSTKARLILGTSLCLFLIVLTFILGQYIQPLHTALSFVTQPIQRAYIAVETWISDQISDFKTLQELKEENEKLKKELDELTYQNTILETDLSQLRELQELWDLSNYYEAYPKTVAQIIGRSPNNWDETFVIDKGQSDELAKYMPVLARNGLVGHITQVFGEDARVTTIVEDTSTVYGQINRFDGGSYLQVKGARGVSGLSDSLDASSLCYADFMTGETDIQIGDEVVTSALGDIYPPGILIGSVIEIMPLGDGQHSRAFIEPTVDLEELQYVLIITDLWKQDMSTGTEGDLE